MPTRWVWLRRLLNQPRLSTALARPLPGLSVARTRRRCLHVVVVDCQLLFATPLCQQSGRGPCTRRGRFSALKGKMASSFYMNDMPTASGTESASSACAEALCSVTSLDMNYMPTASMTEANLVCIEAVCGVITTAIGIFFQSSRLTKKLSKLRTILSFSRGR